MYYSHKRRPVLLHHKCDSVYSLNTYLHSALTASFGGIVGLTLGSSLLSFVELFYFFTVRPACTNVLRRDAVAPFKDTPAPKKSPFVPPYEWVFWHVGVLYWRLRGTELPLLLVWTARQPSAVPFDAQFSVAERLRHNFSTANCRLLNYYLPVMMLLTLAFAILSTQINWNKINHGLHEGMWEVEI